MSITTNKQGDRANQGLTLQQAIEEAHRCMLCYDAPCSKGCPGGTDPAKFIRQIRFYNFKGASRTVLRNNPLGGTCAYICPTEDTCVRECLRAGLDRPIDIDGLQQFAVEYGRLHGVKALERGNQKKQRIAVVGAGPSGLAASAQLARFGYQVTIFEAREKIGGMLQYGVPRARLPQAALDADLNEIISLGIEIRTNTPIENKDGITKLLQDGFSAVFVAPGLWKPYELQLPGIDLEGVTNAIDFLGLVHTDQNKAASFVKGKNIAIVGGGSVAMDVALCARRFGANKIYAIALESMTELPANKKELDQAFKDGVIIKPQCQLTRIVGENNKVVGVEGVETEWIEKGNLSPNNAKPIDGTNFRLKVGAVVQAIGQGPSPIVGKIIAAIDKQGFLIKANSQTQATAIKGVFAGGDIVRGASTVVEAVGDGKRAANAIHSLLSNTNEVQK